MFSINHKFLTPALLALLTACGSGGSSDGDGFGSGGSSSGGGNRGPDRIVFSSVEPKSADANGSSVNLDVRTAVDVPERSNTAPDGYLHVEARRANGDLIGQAAVRALESGQSEQLSVLDLNIGTTDSPQRGVTEITAYITPTRDGDIDSAVASRVTTTQLAFDRSETSFDNITAVDLVVVPGSYVSVLDGNRRDHRFAAQVLNQNGVAISGLEADPGRYFTAFEDGNVDEESPVTVDSERGRLKVFLVIDVSSSITQADADEEVASAATRMVVSLAPTADFNYRQFASDFEVLTSLEGLSFEQGDSGTALYYSLDSALDAITADNSNTTKALIAFTDGRDRKSQDYYAAHQSSDDVLNDFLLQKIADTRAAEASKGGLSVYTLGLGSNIEVSKLEQIAATGGGASVVVQDNDDLSGAFRQIVNLIRSNYVLEYSSQNQTDLSTRIEIQATVNGVSDSEVLRDGS